MRQQQQQPDPGLRGNLSATADDMRKFIASLKGKPASEAMGVVAKSKLFRSILISIVVQAVAVVAISGVSYAVYANSPKATAEADVQPVPPPPTPTNARKQSDDNTQKAAANSNKKAPEQPKEIDKKVIDKVMDTEVDKSPPKMPELDL